MTQRRFFGSLATATVSLAALAAVLLIPSQLLSLPNQDEGEWRDSPDLQGQAFCSSKYEVVGGICVDWWMSLGGEGFENSGTTCCIAEADKNNNSFYDCIEGLR